MKNIFFIMLIQVLVNLSANASMKGNISYDGIFDRGIYDQSQLSPLEVVAEFSIINEETQAIESAIPIEIKLLKKKKLEQINEKYISVVNLLLDSYLSKLGQTSWFVRVVDDLRRNPMGALIDVGCWISHCLEVGTNAPNEMSAGKEHAERGRIVDNQHIDIELLKISAEIEQRKKGIDFEPVFALEKEYVLVKKHITHPRLQDQIERSLLLYRACTGHFLEIERRFVNYALNLPRSPKPIIQVSNRQEDLMRIVNNVRAEFSTFSPEIVNELVNIAVEIANNSVCEENTYTGKLRTIQYFWGKPGGGKTTAVLKLAHILGLPCEHVNISSTHDLSPERLIGKDRFGDFRNIGWFISPLLKEGIDGRTYSNAILLIDDIDLEISPDEVLSILKLYLDPLTKIFDSPFFDCPIKVEHMNIFVTSNSPIPKTEKYVSLRSRVPEVEFLAHKITEYSPVLVMYVNEESFKTGIIITPQDAKLVINAAINVLKKREQEPDLRNMRRTIENIIRQALIDSFDNSNIVSIEETIRRIDVF